MSNPSVALVAPDGRVRPVHHALARRPGSVRGKRIAVLDNTKPNARTLMSAIAEGLVRGHGAAGYDVFDKPNPAVPFRPADRDRLAACDLLIAGSGD